MTAEQARPSADWFGTFMDATPDVYFRYALVPVPCVVYVSRAIHDLTGHPPEAFQGDVRLCLSLIPLEDRRAFRHIARARQGLTTTIDVLRDVGTLVPVQLRTVPVIRGRQIVAIEGVMPPVSRNVTIRIFGGPTYFRVNQAMVNDIRYTQTWNLLGANIVEFTSFTQEEVKASAWGVHGGVDAAWFLSRYVGIGAGIRVNTGKADIGDPLSGEHATLEVGHVTMGGGLRLRF